MLNEALRLIRVYHDLKQTELATRLGISKSHLSEIEKGHKKPTIELIDKYANEFNIPASSILFFSENLDEPDKLSKMKNLIADKVLQILKFVEHRTADG